MTTTRTNYRTDALTAEYGAWLTEQKLPEISAEDLLYGELTDDQRKWVSDFLIRWEAAAKIEDDAARMKAGTRVRTTKVIENFPVIWCEKGETGTIALIDDEGSYWVTLDKHHPELAEWENQIQIWDWSEQDGPQYHPTESLEII